MMSQGDSFTTSRGPATASYSARDILAGSLKEERMPRADRLSPGGVKLLEEAQIAIISTIMPDGSPQSTPVWIDVEPDGSHLLVNTVKGHLKLDNIQRDPRVA